MPVSTCPLDLLIRPRERGDGIIIFRAARLISRYPVTRENLGPALPRSARRGIELSTIVARALAFTSCARKASRMALADCSAPRRLAASAKTVDPDPLIANPAAPASSGAGRPASYPRRDRAPAGP